MTRAFHPDRWMVDEVERRKQLWRDLFLGRPVERIPLDIRVLVKSEFPMREQIQRAEVQLEVALAQVAASWELGERSDWIPAMRPDVGCSCLATAFGAEYYWGENPEQTPGIKAPIITDLEAELPSLTDPDPATDGWLPEGIDRIRRFAEAGNGYVPVSLLDAAGGLNVAADLLGVSELLISLFTAPEAVHELLARIQRLFIATIEAGIEAAGGEDQITTTDFPDFWFPEGRKGHVSDDLSANFGPDTYRVFSAPYHAMVFDRFGAGGLHNCGPNPCHEAYVDGDVAPFSLDLSDAYSHGDLDSLRESLSGRAFIYLSFDNSRDRRVEPVGWYREIMERCAPELIVVPVLSAGSAEEGARLYDELAPIAREYASRTRWGWWRRDVRPPY